MHCHNYLRTTSEIALAIDPAKVEIMAGALDSIRAKHGRVFIIGMGGSLANAIHMAADLRKLCEIDAYAPDNIAELTARANDEGLETIFTGWLRGLTSNDCLFVLSVGGGTETVSKAISKAVEEAHKTGAEILGIVGPVGGVTRRMGDHVLCLPDLKAGHITPHSEAFQAVICHALVSHPMLQKRATKW